MSTITTKDGVSIFYKDWGSGQPIVFSHSWPLSADDWDAQMMFFLNHGFRVIAHDRRGHGRSSQTGGGEVVRYIARHGESRVAKAVLISAVPPLMVKTPANPGGTPKEVFDGFQTQVAEHRAQFYLDLPTGPLSAKLLKNGTLKTYKGFPHGMPTTEAATINADLLAFTKS
jgi:non-heme chloroperoxidase